jgi:hypothetical protein
MVSRGLLSGILSRKQFVCSRLIALGTRDLEDLIKSLGRSQSYQSIGICAIDAEESHRRLGILSSRSSVSTESCSRSCSAGGGQRGPECSGGGHVER